MDLEKAKAEAEALKKRMNAESVNPNEERLANLQAEIEAEEKRLNSKAYKSALKAIDDLAEEAAALKAEAFTMLDDILAIVDKWEAVTKKRHEIAVAHFIQTKDLYWADAIKTDELVGLKKRIEAWKGRRNIYKKIYNAKPNTEPPKSKDKPHKSMMGKRYPEV